MEIEFFVKPDDGPAAFDQWLGQMREWVDAIGLSPEHVRVREHSKDELSHYSSRTIDFEYLFPDPMGWKELYGLANRTDFDLTRHQEYSGEDLRYFEQETGERFVPNVIEPTFGVDRSVLVVLLDAYDEEETVDVNGKPDIRTVLRLAPALAPFKAAVLPLMRKPELSDLARTLFSRIQDETDFVVDYDETANIGKRYRRQDEIGTPFCVTVDYESLDDQQVTIRYRDSMEQDRIPISDVPGYLHSAIRRGNQIPA
jgi:glycyl-tRNA synthetase